MGGSYLGEMSQGNEYPVLAGSVVAPEIPHGGSPRVVYVPPMARLMTPTNRATAPARRI